MCQCLMHSITRMLNVCRVLAWPTIMTFYSSSHARLEKKLNLLITEVRAGRREGSVVSVQTIDTIARNNQESWDVLRRELEDIGISPGVISEKRQFIIAWFQEAVAAGQLEEDTPSDDEESLVLTQESNNHSSDSDTASVSGKEVSQRNVSPSKSASITEFSSIAAMRSVNEIESKRRSSRELFSLLAVGRFQVTKDVGC